MLRKALTLFGSAMLALPTTLLAADEAADHSGDPVINMPIGVTEVSSQIYNLHMLIFWICIVIGVLTFGAMFWAMYFHRKSRGHEAENWHHSTKVELAWTIIPAFILIAMAFPASKALIELYDTDDAELDIRITGYQWKWQYTYPEAGVQFMSELSTTLDEINNLEDKGQYYLQEVNEPLVIPTNTKVRFLLNSVDVIHSWWVPDFGVKKDAIPGHINETWANVTEPGIYRGACTELCGQNHAFMPVVVHAMEPEEFNTWLDERRTAAEELAAMTEQTFTMEELMARGEEAYNRSCAACHQANGAGIPPAFPALVGSAIATGPVEDHLEIVVNGKAGTTMQAFGAQLSEVDIAAIITYERNAWGNNVGDLVQPIDVYNYKQGL